jgi:gliding motility-associated-like protein
MKLRSDGSAEWASHISGKHSEYPSSITSDRNGNVYATGYFLDTINFDNIQLVGDTIPDINGQLSGSLFLVKYNLTGNPEWAKANEIKNTKDKFLTADIASDISIDQNDNAVIVGFITNELKLDETSLISCDENGDAFIAAFNPSGKVIGIAKVGGITNTNGLGEVGRYICTDKMGNYYIAGDFTSPTAYLGQLILNSTGLENIFLGKLGELPWVYGAFSISADSEINCKEPLTVDLSASFSCSAFPSRLDKKSAPTIIELTSEDKTMVPLPLKIGESMDDQIVCTLPDSLITGVYLIRANWKGSIASKEVEINVNCRPFIPNVFTPDHDGKNDKFRAQISKSGIADMEIYDRWGTMIYRGDAKTGWDGESYPSGVYFYLIKFGSKKYKGWLSLIRG